MVNIYQNSNDYELTWIDELESDIDSGVIYHIPDIFPNVPQNFDVVEYQVLCTNNNFCDKAIDGEVFSYKRLAEVILRGARQERIYRGYQDDDCISLGFYLGFAREGFTDTGSKQSPNIMYKKQGGDTVANVSEFNPKLPDLDLKADCLGDLGLGLLPTTSKQVGLFGNTQTIPYFLGQGVVVKSAIIVDNLWTSIGGGDAMAVNYYNFPQIQFSASLNFNASNLDFKITRLTFPISNSRIPINTPTRSIFCRTYSEQAFSVLPYAQFLAVRAMQPGSTYRLRAIYFRLLSDFSESV